MQSKTKKFKNKLTKLMLNLDYTFFKLTKFLRKKINLDKINNILIVELTYIGDLIATTPAIKALRQKFPDAKIDLLTFPNMLDVLKGNPNLNEIVPYDKNTLNKIRDQYDLAIVLRPGSFKIGRLLLKANVPYKIGPRKTGLFEGKGFFFNLKPKPSKLQHIVYDNLEVLKLINAKNENPRLEVYTDKESINSINKLLKKNNKLIAIHPSSKDIKKLKNPSHIWEAKKWAELTDKLVKKYKAKIIITGTKDELFLAEEVASLMKNKPIILAGKTNIRELIALVSKLDLLISIDTGIVHIAAALNKPVISLMGPQLPRIWKPFNKKGIAIYHNEECTGCQRLICNDPRCMKAITVNDVLEAVKLFKL